MCLINLFLFGVRGPYFRKRENRGEMKGPQTISNGIGGADLGKHFITLPIHLVGKLEMNT